MSPPTETSSPVSLAALFAVLSALMRIVQPAFRYAALYVIAWTVLLPLYSSGVYTRPFGPTLGLLVSAIVAALCVELALNWAYAVVSAAPVLVGGTFMVIGTTGWMFAPLVIGFTGYLGSGAFSFLGSIDPEMGFSGLSALGNLSWLIDFVSRVALTVVSIGGLLIGVHNWAKALNQTALALFLVVVAMYGAASGVAGFTPGLVTVLVILTSIRLSLEGSPGLRQFLGLVASSLAILGVAPIDTSRQGLTPEAAQFVATALNAYKVLVAGGLVVAIWRPGLLLTLAPRLVANWFSAPSGSLSRLVRVRLNAADPPSGAPNEPFV